MYPYGVGETGMLNMLILEILEVYSDCEHRLTQADIIKLLDNNYGIRCDRRTIKSNIVSLIKLGYDISLKGGYYLIDRTFDNAELRLLIDSVLFAKGITQAQAKRLIDKLEGLGNRYFHAKVRHIHKLPELQHSDNAAVMHSLDTLNDALEQGKKISFIYNSYGTDFKLHPRKEHEYIVSPYDMVANNGHFYLIGNYDKYDNLSHYRIDRMTGVRILDEPVKQRKEIKDFEQGYNLPKHMAEHIYMYSGESVQVKFWTYESMMDQLIDWFGRDFRIIDKDEEDILVSVRCNKEAFICWALQYGRFVEVVAPMTLREELRNIIDEMYKVYHTEEGTS